VHFRRKQGVASTLAEGVAMRVARDLLRLIDHGGDAAPLVDRARRLRDALHRRTTPTARRVRDAVLLVRGVGASK
jgi:hypothetical protein